MSTYLWRLGLEGGSGVGLGPGLLTSPGLSAKKVQAGVQFELQVNL